MSETQAPESDQPKLSNKGHQAFLAASLVGLGCVLILAGILRWGTLSRASELFVYRPLLVGMITLLALWLVLYAVKRACIGWRTGLVLCLAIYVSLEQFGAPHMTRALRMGPYVQLQGPDHLPHHTSPRDGWNSDSLRCPHQPGRFRKEGTNIVILGDSFTFGMRLKAEECFPRLVEQQLTERFPRKDIKVANFAWNSSSPLLSWRRLKSIGAKYKPDLVVLCVDMTDIRDDIRWRAMFQKDGAYWLMDNFPLAMRSVEVCAPSAYKLLFRTLNPNMPQERFFMSEAPLEETRHFFEDITTNIGRIKTWCDEHGARFAVIVLPRTYQYSERESPKNWEASAYTVLGPYSLEPFRFFEQLSENVDYPIHSILETFKNTTVFPTSFEDDPHWNPAGAKVAAQAVFEILLEELALLGLP